MGVSKNRGTPKTSPILIGFSMINHACWGTPIFGNTHMSNTFIILSIRHITPSPESSTNPLKKNPWEAELKQRVNEGKAATCGCRNHPSCNIQQRNDIQEENISGWWFQPI